MNQDVQLLELSAQLSELEAGNGGCAVLRPRRLACSSIMPTSLPSPLRPPQTLLIKNKLNLPQTLAQRRAPIFFLKKRRLALTPFVGLPPPLRPG